MKRSFLLASLLCTLFSWSSAQTPTYFDNTSFWGYHRWFGTSNFPGSCIHTIDTYWTIDGDSTVLGHTWYRLYSTGSYQIDCTYSTTHHISKHAHEYAGLLRQEGKQMRMVFPNTMTEAVIYDFDLHIGDFFFPNVDTSQLLTPSNLVASIAPFPGDTTRLVFTSEPMYSGWGNRWVEGIGAVRGTVFGPQWVNCYSSECVTVGTLTCYRMQGHDFGFSECTSAWQHYQAIALAVTDTEPGLTADAPTVRLSPNPGHDRLSLYVSEINARDIRLINSSGQVVCPRSDFTMEGDGVFSLSVGHLPTGLYQVLVYGGNTVVALKWVKM